MITKEKLIERLEAYNRDLQALSSQMVAVRGAIMDIEYWLSTLDSETDGKDNPQ